MIQGKRIALRAIEAGDFEKIWQWENDSEVMALASSSPERCISMEAIRKSFERSGFPERGSFRYMIVDENGAPLGLASYWTPNSKFHLSVELGIYVGEKQHWSKGYGSDAFMTLLYLLFKHLGVHRVSIVTGSHNQRMLKMLQRLGIRQEGEAREERFIHGRFYDSVLMGVLADEFDEIYARWSEKADVYAVAAA